MFEHEITQFGIGYKQACKDITSLMHVSEEEKCVELTPQIEEKITKEIEIIMKEHTIIEGVLRCNKHFCDYDGMTLTDVVFQKLKEQLM